MISSEKREMGGWWIWIGLFVVFSIAVLTGLRYAGILGHTIIERKVFESSHQYHQAKKQEVSIFSAQLAEIDHKLSNPNLDPTVRVNLEATAAGLRIQLNATRSR